MSDYDNTNKGALFKNTRRETERHPHYTGHINIDGTEYWLSAWINTSKDGEKYMSLTRGDVRNSQPSTPAPPTEIPEDDIPFLMDYPNLNEYTYFAYDTETTGLHYPVDRAFGFSITTPDEKEYYYDVRTQPKSTDWINDTFGSYSGIVICHNAAFDAIMSRAAGIAIPYEILDCTIVRACLIDEHLGTQFPWQKGRRPGGYDLDYVGKKYVGRGKIEIHIGSIASLPEDQVREYACYDTTTTLKLWEWQRDEIERQGLGKITAFERTITPLLIDSMARGIRVDIDAAERAAVALDPVIDRRQRELNDLVGRNYNVNSPKQTREIFNPYEIDHHWYVGDTRIGRTTKGAPSFSGEHMLRLAEVNPVAERIIDLRSTVKTRDTFLKGHVLGHEVDGRVYPTINQTAGERGGTKTGRLSYVEPAMQQIPSRDKETASIVKPVFLPDEGQVWVDCDKASFEVRVFAALVSKFNDSLVRVYEENPQMDFHQYVADLTDLPRNARKGGEPNAKQLNLSMIFTQGAGATAAKMGLPTTDAEFEDDYGDVIKYKKAGRETFEIIDRYHQAVPGIRELAARCKEIVEYHKSIKTHFGRRLRFPKKYRSYKASGLLIQATSADLNKESWLLGTQAVGDRGRIVLNTHDSYSFSINEGEHEQAYADIKNAIEREVMGIPLVLHYSGVGRNWWAALNNEGI